MQPLWAGPLTEPTDGSRLRWMLQMLADEPIPGWTKLTIRKKCSRRAPTKERIAPR
jgi:hypothetical protein